MDLGIAGRKAIVCAASKGLGKGCAVALAREGVHVTILARGEETLSRTADEIRNAGGEVTAVVADVTTPGGREAALEACPTPDILVNNAGGPPPGKFRDWTPEDWHKAVNDNMITAIELIKATIDPMIERGFGRVVNITSSSVKAPIPVLGLSNGARAGLTGFISGLAREVAPKGVTINNLLPGVFDTDRIRTVSKAEAERSGRSLEEVMAGRAGNVPVGRLGDPAEFGEWCAFLCSMQASYFTAQNVLLDGGAYPGTF